MGQGHDHGVGSANSSALAKALALTGTAASPVARGTPITLQVKNPGGRSGQVRF